LLAIAEVASPAQLIVTHKKIKLYGGVHGKKQLLSVKNVSVENLNRYKQKNENKL